MKIKDGTNLTQDQDPDPRKGWTTPAQALDMVTAGYVGSPGPIPSRGNHYILVIHREVVVMMFVTAASSLKAHKNPYSAAANGSVKLSNCQTLRVLTHQHLSVRPPCSGTSSSQLTGSLRRSHFARLLHVLQSKWLHSGFKLQRRIINHPAGEKQVLTGGNCKL